MKIILVRHGLSEANVAKTYSLRDTKLHTDGYDLLKTTAKNLKKFEIGEVYTSELFRSQETAKLLGFDDFIIDSRLNELDFGDFKGRSFTDVKATHPEYFTLSEKQKFTHKFPNGESRMDVMARMADFLEEKSKADKNILCISHGIALKASLFWILNDLTNWDKFWIDNGSITIFDVTAGKKKIEGINIL